MVEILAGNMARRSEVLSKLDELDERTTTISNELTQLYDVLMPILDTQTPTSRDMKAGEKEPLACDVAIRLRGILDNLDHALMRLIEIKNAVRL